MREKFPTGTVTFLFTGVEGSTRLLRELGADRYAGALAEHRRLIRQAWRAGRLRGAAQGLRETRGRRPIRADLPFPEVPEAARDEGAAMSLDEAVDYALRTR